MPAAIVEDHLVLRGERRDDRRELLARSQSPVQQQHRLAVAVDFVVELHPVHLDVAALHRAGGVRFGEPRRLGRRRRNCQGEHQSQAPPRWTQHPHRNPPSRLHRSTLLEGGVMHHMAFLRPRHRTVSAGASESARRGSVLTVRMSRTPR